jgi:hypothetical protein
MFLEYLRKKIYQKKTKILPIINNKEIHKNKFKYFNFEFKNYGSKNPKKIFYIIRRSPGAGFFSNLNFVIHNLLICEKLKFIPVIDMKNYPTIYNCKNKINGNYNSWLYYFKPVSKYKLSEVYKSKNVILCDNKTSRDNAFSSKNYKDEFKYLNGFRFLNKEHHGIFKKYIIIKKDILKIANNFIKNNFKKKVLGICFRGSDQKKSGYHPYPPTKEQMLFATDALIKKYKFKKIYLCTEDIDYLNLYKKKYVNKIIYFNNPRTNDKKDLFKGNNNKHRYKIGLGNLIDMIILSKTDYLLHGISNIPEAAIFYSKLYSNRKNFPRSLVNNGMSGNVFISQFSFYLKQILPFALGGFKKNILKV